MENHENRFSKSVTLSSGRTVQHLLCSSQSSPKPQLLVCPSFNSLGVVPRYQQLLLKNNNQQSKTAPSVPNSRKAVKSMCRQSLMCLQNATELYEIQAVSDTSCFPRSTTNSELISMTTYCDTYSGFQAHREFFGTFRLSTFNFYKVSLGGSVLQSKHHCNNNTNIPLVYVHDVELGRSTH